MRRKCRLKPKRTSSCLLLYRRRHRLGSGLLEAWLSSPETKRPTRDLGAEESNGDEDSRKRASDVRGHPQAA